jgi:hypothetical protein
MTDKPKVFESGALTLAVSDSGVTACIGQKEIHLFSRILVILEPGQPPSVGVEFQRSNDPGTRVGIEEEARLASTLRFLKPVT